MLDQIEYRSAPSPSPCTLVISFATSLSLTHTLVFAHTHSIALSLTHTHCLSLSLSLALYELMVETQGEMLDQIEYRCTPAPSQDYFSRALSLAVFLTHTHTLSDRVQVDPYTLSISLALSFSLSLSLTDTLSLSPFLSPSLSPSVSPPLSRIEYRSSPPPNSTGNRPPLTQHPPSNQTILASGSRPLKRRSPLNGDPWCTSEADESIARCAGTQVNFSAGKGWLACSDAQRGFAAGTACCAANSFQNGHYVPGKKM